LQGWWEVQHKYARKHGFITTAFGRKYPVPDINHQDGGFRSKAERNSVNGPIQGAGADIIKIAMAMVFKEFKKRGWLDKARMIASMHDELVFEVHKSILKEAIAVAKQLMCRNGFVLGKKWIVPLTSDTEIGHTWNVPWDLNAMLFKEVRFHGDKKIKGPDKCPEGVEYASLPHFPASLAGVFTTEGDGGGGGEETPPAGPTLTVVEGSNGDSGAMAKTTLTTPAASPQLAKGEFYFHTIHRAITLETMNRLAQVIHECHGKGTRRLGLRLPDGTVLDGWSNGMVLVNEQEFHFAAQRAGV
jgi:hypothetical protein